ncbi:MAG: ATPase, T2SS/T4P/T4SS family [Clostridia bacterium]|jgi:pilus assembly protein CpaF|nr:ATPase, T2SS/T4P/T4SS family [Clostridia bacterium]
MRMLSCNTEAPPWPGQYYRQIAFEEAVRLVTGAMTDPRIQEDLKELHTKLLSEAVLRKTPAREYVKAMIGQVLDAGPYQVLEYSYDQAVAAIFNEMYGLGPLEELIDDPQVQEITVNGFDNIWYEKNGLKQRAENLSFQNNEKLLQVISRCLPNKEVNRLEAFAQSNFDGARVYVGIPPVAKAPYLNYRKFSVFRADEESYLESHALTPEALAILKIFVRHRTNIAVIGAQNTGKTTLLSFLTDYYPERFRIGVLESPEFEAAIEERRPRGNVFSLKADEKLHVTELDIFKHALRFSADVLIIPEARGAEMEEGLKAMRRGNRGSMITMHSTSPQNLVDDIALMITETGKPYQLHLLKMMIAKSLDVVITTHQFADGTRKVIGIAEVDYDDLTEQIVVQELFRWTQGKLVRTNQPVRSELAHSLHFHGAEEEALKKWGLFP